MDDVLRLGGYASKIIYSQFYLSFNYIIAGFAFVYFEDDRDAADAIRGLDNTPFGYDRRRLSVEWARVCYYSFLFFMFTILSSSIFVGINAL